MIYFLTLECEGLNVIAGLNGAPLVPNPMGNSFHVSTAINEWLMPENNHLTIRLDWPKEKSYEAGVARLLARVVLHGNKTPLASVIWPIPGAKESYPYSFRIPFSLATVPDTRLFHEPVHAGIGADDRAAALAPVLALHAALADRDIQSALNLLRFRFSEIEAAYPDERESATEPARQTLEDLLAAAEVSLAQLPRSSDQLRLEPTAAGYLFHVKGPDSRDPIRFELGDEILEIPIFIGKVSGDWVIAR